MTPPRKAADDPGTSVSAAATSPPVSDSATATVWPPARSRSRTWLARSRAASPADDPGDSDPKTTFMPPLPLISRPPVLNDGAASPEARSRRRSPRLHVGDQIDSLTAGHHRADHVSGRELTGRDRSPDRRHPVHLGGLVGGPAPEGPGRAVLGLFLDQHVQGLAEPALGPLGHQLVGQPGELLDPAGDLSLVQVAGQRRGLGAVLVGVAEDPDRVKADVAQEKFKFPQVVGGLTREAHDEVGPDPGL